MKIALTVLIAVHGFIHLMGPARAWGYGATMPLSPISKGMGVVWLVAAALLLSSAAALWLWPTRWWWIAVPAVVVSQLAIVRAWHDAGYGTLANALIAGAAALSYLGSGPGSFRRDFARELAKGTIPDTRLVTDADLAPLPPAVQRYVRRSGAVGLPRVHSMHVRFHGRIRSAPDAPWMSYVAEQRTDFDAMSRHYLVNARRFGVPVEAYHVYEGSHATMRVKAASLVSVATAAGPEMDEAETVTLLNDLIVWAPAALIDARIEWHEIDPRTVVATFSNAGHTVSAHLTFDESGDLVNFQSEDRQRAGPDGTMLGKTRWTTPLSRYGSFGGVRVASRGEARWTTARGEWTYAEAEVDALEYNPRGR
jgi:hypothetical protein